MPRGTRRTSYVRDGRGRFASTPGGGAPKRPPAKKASRGTNRLTRDNSGRITSVGGNGATARGGRLRTGAGNLRARQTDRLKGAPQGVVSRGGKARAGGGAPKVPPRIANRSAADQAHRDKLAKQWKTVEKPARRAYASMRSARRGAAGLIPDYPRLTKARKIRGDARFVSGNIEDQVTRLMRSPSRGKNKLTPQQRGQIVADTLYSARSLRARAAMTTPRRSTRNVRAARPGGTIAKPRGLKPGALKAKTKKTGKRVLSTERIRSANANLKTRLTKVLDELRKVENAKNRDNSPMASGSNFSPRYQKLIARGAKADRQLESLRKAAKKLKQIELGYTPEKYGFARGTAQRKALAAEIRKARGQLTRLQREEATAKKAYEADPVVKFGLWGEIGQNRRQSRKTKERNGNAAMSRADRYVGARIAIRQQQNAIKQLRGKAKQQTQETNKRQKPRKP